MIRTKCPTCARKVSGNATRAKNKLFNKNYKKLDHCEVCGQTHEPSVLSEDHIDGDQTNSSIDNFMTVCANCHAVKSDRERMLSMIATAKMKLYKAKYELYKIKKHLNKENIEIPNFSMKDSK